MPQRPAHGNLKTWTRAEQMFNTLYMRSASDLTARIRDAAVSPALVVHHFGSKDGLRQASDEYVLDAIRSGADDRWPTAFTEIDRSARP
jgi:hypothetical protein